MAKFKKQITCLAVGSISLDILVLIIAALFSALSLRFFLGLMLGTVFEMLIFLSMIYSTQKTLEKSAQKGQIFGGLWYFIRLFFIAAFLYFCMKSSYFSFWGALIPLFYTKIIFVIVYTIGKESWR